MQFKNPVNGHIETRGAPGLWAFLFGGFYFLVGGHWTHFVVWLFVAIGTIGIHPGLGFFAILLMALIYASLAGSIVRNAYLRRGWIEIGDSDATTSIASGVAQQDYRRCPYCAEEIRIEAIKCKHCGSDVDPVPRPPAPRSDDERFAALQSAHGVTRGGAGYVWNGHSYVTLDAIEAAVELSRLS